MTARATTSAKQILSPKRIKLESSEVTLTTGHDDALEMSEGDHCSICLQPVIDRTVLPVCAHEFCFECIIVWTGQYTLVSTLQCVIFDFNVDHTEQSRRCPLCAQVINDYLIHHIRSKYDYQKHYLTPLRTSLSPRRPDVSSQQRRPMRREQRWGRRTRRDVEEQEEADELERAIARRRWIYENGLYAKVGEALDASIPYIC